MSAGKGVLHSEFNPSRERKVHFLQIWIEPAVRGIAPSYEQANVPAEAKRGRLALIAGPDGSGAAVAIHQDARLYATLLEAAECVTHPLASGRRAYVHVARGRVQAKRSGARRGRRGQFEGETSITLERGEAAEVLVFDLP